MSKKMKLIPELRFPEFSKDREWELKHVDEYFDVGSSKRILQKDWTNKGVPFYRTRELVSLSKSEPFGSEIFISESLYSKLKEKYGVPSEGDFLVSGVGTLGISYQVKACDKFYFKDGNVLWFKLKGDLNSLYFKFCFESKHIQNQINAQTSKSTVGTYTIQNAKKTEFCYPPKHQEQQKIASCLSSLDELITAHSDKLETLKDHKKGLMQNLFPQKGQKIPNYRFPEFEKDGEWSEEKLENVASFSKGKGISKSDIAENGRVPCIRYGELYTHYNETISFVHSYTNLDPKNLVLSEANDVIIPASGETQIDIATASCVLAEGIALGGDLNIIKTIINGVFLSYFLNNAKKMDIARIAQGISVVHLYANQLRTLILNIPKPKEQEKIAICLSALDELITAQSEKIEQLQQHKKGLMQGLFPNTNEIR